MVSARTHKTDEKRDKVVSELQPLLTDLIVLSLQGKQAHWNVTGPLFSAVHAQLDAVVNHARTSYDSVAERIVTLGVPAAGQIADLGENTSLEPLPGGTIPDREAVRFISDRISRVIARGRQSVDRLGDLDLVSQDLVIGIVGGLEKDLWMLKVQLD